MATSPPATGDHVSASNPTVFYSLNTCWTAKSNMPTNLIWKIWMVGRMGLSGIVGELKHRPVKLRSCAHYITRASFFMSETKTNSQGISNLAWKIDFNDFVSYPTNGKAGGLALFWQDQYKFDVRIKGKYFLRSVVFGISNVDSWFVTSIQGPSYAIEKETFLSKLESIRENAWKSAFSTRMHIFHAF